MSSAAKNETGIAIVGMAGRFPKARNLDEFWRNLCEGVDAVSFFTDRQFGAELLFRHTITKKQEGKG